LNAARSSELQNSGSSGTGNHMFVSATSLCLPPALSDPLPAPGQRDELHPLPARSTPNTWTLSFAFIVPQMRESSLAMRAKLENVDSIVQSSQSRTGHCNAILTGFSQNPACKHFRFFGTALRNAAWHDLKSPRTCTCTVPLLKQCLFIISCLA
jgi:hypothetical protein